MARKFVKTVWELRTYDVLGNERDGYEVNDSFLFDRHCELTITVETYNAGTPHEFQSAAPSDRQIRKAFGLRKIQLDTDGDDLNVYVNARRDGYPIGEMRCVSHASLSPICKIALEVGKPSDPGHETALPVEVQPN